MALVAGFGVCLWFLANVMLSWALTLHAKIMLASSIFYMTPAESISMKKSSVQDRTRSEFESRSWLEQLPVKRWLFCGRGQSFIEAEWNINRRLDIGRFLHD